MGLSCFRFETNSPTPAKKQSWIAWRLARTRFCDLGCVDCHKGQTAHELIETRCQRDAAIAKQLRFSEAVSQGIECLDEHWNGTGEPVGLKGDKI